VDLTKACFETCLKPGEETIEGDERFRRLKSAGHILLDAGIFQTLWENQHLIPESWKEKTKGNTTLIYFDGTVFRHPRSERNVLCLYWRDGSWHWRMFWLVGAWFASDPSAVLTS
jgi:hypothetical protein